MPFVRLCGCRSWGVRGCCGWLQPGPLEYPNLWSGTRLDVLDLKLKRRRSHECIPELLTWQPHLLQSGFCRRWPWIWRGSQTVVSVVDGEKSFVLQTHSSGFIRFNPLNSWFSTHTCQTALRSGEGTRHGVVAPPSVLNGVTIRASVSPASSWSAGRWMESWTAGASLSRSDSS